MRLFLEQKLKELAQMSKEEHSPNQVRKSTSQHVCEFCQNRGIVLRDGQAERCSCMKRKAILSKFKHANIGQQFQNFRFENFDLKYYPAIKPDSEDSTLTYLQTAQRTLAAAKTFVSEIANNKATKGILFCGPVGSGKTFLAGSIANALISQNKEVLFAVVPDLLDEIRSTYTKQTEHGNTEMVLTEAARRAEILILDDLGAHNYTEWTINKLYSIINFRVNNCLPLIVTTNLELAELEERLGLRITSRLLQLCQIYRLLVDTDIRYQLYTSQAVLK